MKHAKRDRGGDSDEDAAPAKVAASTPDIPDDLLANNSPPSQPEVDASLTETASATEVAEPVTEPEKGLADVVGIKPISERKPDNELSVAARRRKAFDNLQKINEALLLYVAKKGHFPKAHSTNAGGVPTLSWRVELLPYLGYAELYKKFDFKRAWNMPPNKELLQFIPDAYVSPERFDVKTNYLFPVDQAFMFGQNRVISPTRIDDGAENTIMLIEVNDAHAVNWTEPKDFKPKSPMNMKPYLGKLRVDGTFAIWASGFPVLLDERVSNQQLFEAMTYEKSDALQAGDIHRPITVEEAEEDPVLDSGMSDPPDLIAGDETAPQPNDGMNQMNQVMDEPVINREPVPSPLQITKAQTKLRQIYREKLEEAKDADDKADLAKELLDAAADMDADPSGAFVLQQAALRLAIEAADAGILIRAVDQRVGRFEVDSFQENLKWIQAFGQATASKDASTVEGDDILQRAIPVIFAGIREDEYMLASSVARLANRYTSTDREDKVSRLFTRLRTQLGAAKREYDKSVGDLERYRINPDDVAAGVSVGSFLCFIKGDWDKGLKLIAEGRGGDLVEVVRMDLRGASRAGDQVAIGDAWWDLSRRGSGAYQQGAQDRAVLWYTQAVERLPESLDKIHVQNRLKEADETDGRSPIALCAQLSDEIGVDIGQSLTSIAVNGMRSAAGRADDDDDD